MAINPITSPSLLTDAEQGLDACRYYLSHGYKVIWFQAQNSEKMTDRNLRPAKDAGMAAGVWGVTYAVDDENNNPHHLSFFDQNKILGQQAGKLGAQHVMVDAELCLTGTRSARGAKPMIDGVRAGGWNGPVHLTTLGAPVQPKSPEFPQGNDYEYDLGSFLDTGGGIFPQCYAQASSYYTPWWTFRYYRYLGVPLDHLNAMIWIGNSIAPSTQVDLLREANISTAISLFMPEYVDAIRDETYNPLDVLTKPAPTSTDLRLTLDPRLVTLRDDAQTQIVNSTTKNPSLWATANPREYQVLVNYLLYRVMFNVQPPLVDGWVDSTGRPRPYDPPVLATKIGAAGADLLEAAAALVGRLP